MTDGISVIIPTYNYGRFIKHALESVLVQTLRPMEVIVVDDGSTDGTEKVVRGFSEAVLYIRQENLGVCAARNRGVMESCGKMIAFMDADDIWEPSKLEKQAAKFAGDAELGLVHCGMREFDSDTGKTISLNTEGIEGWVADELLLWERPSVNVSGSAIMVSRETFDTVEGFDRRLKVGEDWDFCYRVARLHKVGFVAEPLVNYRTHAAAAHHKVDDMERGMALFYEKAFNTKDEDILALRRRALGNYHKVISGSFFRAANLFKFASHAIKSIFYRPANISYFLKFPLRRFSGIRLP